LPSLAKLFIVAVPARNESIKPTRRNKLAVASHEVLKENKQNNSQIILISDILLNFHGKLSVYKK